jgi:hypothetical protein
VVSAAVGSESLNAAKSVDDTLMPQDAVSRAAAEQAKRVAAVAMAVSATRAAPERLSM